MAGSDGLVSCVGGCNSTIFKSRRIHRPIVEQQANIHLLQPPTPKESQNLYYSHGKYRRSQNPLPPICQYVPKVKLSRKRRDRKASGVELPLDRTIRIDDDSDDEETTTKRSRPLAVQFMFWFFGILIVVIGVGALVFAIVIVCTSMDKLTKIINSAPMGTNTNQMRKFSGKRVGSAGNLAPWDTTFPP